MALVLIPKISVSGLYDVETACKETKILYTKWKVDKMN